MISDTLVLKETPKWTVYQFVKILVRSHTRTERTFTQPGSTLGLELTYIMELNQGLYIIIIGLISMVCLFEGESYNFRILCSIFFQLSIFGRISYSPIPI